MPLHPVYGHENLRKRLTGSIRSGRFPHSALLGGPAGVGKQRLALWIAQALHCEESPGEPCDTCQSCRLALHLTHPDIHWYVPIPRIKATDPSKQVEEAQQLLAEAMEERRQNPVYGPAEGMSRHPLASIRLLQTVAARTPFRSKIKVLILGDADRLIVQESNPEAANALLKLLEEPPEDCYMIVTSSEPRELLPTIRSRLIPMHVGRLSDQEVRAFLTTEGASTSGKELDQRVWKAEGSIGRAVWYDSSNNDAERWARNFLDAVSRGTGAWAPAVLAQVPWEARGAFSIRLDALTRILREQLKEDAEKGLNSSAEGRLRALHEVDRVKAETRTNLNPQLALAILAHSLENHFEALAR